MSTPPGSVMTVTGAIPAAQMGVTLMHEHILNDCSCWWNPPVDADRQYLADTPVSLPVLSELRQDPFVCKHNLCLNDEALAIVELGLYKNVGGCTVVDPTCRGIGRNPEALVRISRNSELNIVMGAGYYLQSSHPPELATLSASAVAEQIIAEATNGMAIPSTHGVSNVKIGLIGEIGVSSEFTADERKSLRGAAMAQVNTHLPLMIHLPAWFRLGHEVLDIVEKEGVDPHRVVLCHMNPSHHDFQYQQSLAQRGAFIEYDMIGMDYFYADQQVQCPSDDEAAAGIVRLIDSGFIEQILLSQDVFLKMMLTHYGGNGYAFVQRHFLPRLKRHGLSDEALISLTQHNPRRVFEPDFEPASG